MTIEYLTIEDILLIHEDQIRRYGGSFGIRDQEAIEAAVARPQSGYYDGPIEAAAALWESLSQNHPFIDGNKRTAFDATFTFLALNDIEITADADQTANFIYDAFDKRIMNFENLMNWLRENTSYDSVV